MARSAYAEKVDYLHDPGNVAAHICTYSQVNAEYDRVVIDGRCKSSCTTVPQEDLHHPERLLHVSR